LRIIDEMINVNMRTEERASLALVVYLNKKRIISVVCSSTKLTWIRIVVIENNVES